MDNEIEYALCPECATGQIAIPADADDDDRFECEHCGAQAPAGLLRMDLMDLEGGK